MQIGAKIPAADAWFAMKFGYVVSCGEGMLQYRRCGNTTFWSDNHGKSWLDAGYRSFQHWMAASFGTTFTIHAIGPQAKLPTSSNGGVFVEVGRFTELIGTPFGVFKKVQ